MLSSSFASKMTVCAAVALALCAPLCASADDYAYMGTYSDQFGTIDLSTGVFTQTGSTGQTLAGFAQAGGVLYATSYHTTGQLFTVNTTTGALTSVGATGMGIDDFGSTTTGLYALDGGANLYSIDPTTGAGTLIGYTGLGYGSWRSLSSDGSTLYFATGNSLYSLNTTTAASTYIGSLGGSSQMGAMTFVGGQLYGGANGGPALYVASIDPSSGNATLGATVSGATGSFFALAPVAAPVPEPASGLLLLAGLGVLAVRRRPARPHVAG